MSLTAPRAFLDRWAIFFDLPLDLHDTTLGIAREGLPIFDLERIPRGMDNTQQAREAPTLKFTYKVNICFESLSV